MSVTRLYPPDPPEREDGICYKVKSRTDPHAEYKCELTHYSGSGACSCEDFDFNFRPLLSRLVTPARALEEGLVKLRSYQRPEEALCCWHLIEARRQFTIEAIQAVIADNATRREAISRPVPF